MKTDQKGSANALLIILVVLLAGTVIYFVFIKKPVTQFEQIPVPSSTSATQSSNTTSNSDSPSPTSGVTSSTSMVTGYSIKSSDTVSVNSSGLVLVNGNAPFPGADPKTFQLLGDGFAKDNTHIWRYDDQGVHNETVLAQKVDVPSFAVLNNSYVKDKNGVYQGDLYNLQGGAPLKLMSGVDTNTAVALDNDNIKDASHAYDFTGAMFSKIVDVKTLVSLGQNSNGDSHWFKDSVHVYAGDGEIVPYADPATFKDLGMGYGKDKSHVFYDDDVTTFVSTSTPSTGSIVAGADLNSFVVVGNSYPYAKDNTHVYAGGKVLQYADPATFAQVGDSNFFKDKTHVWLVDDHNEQIFDLIPQADAVTFVLVNSGSITAQDAHNTYSVDGRGNLTVTPKN
jgi:hypothetical protein